MGEHKVIYLHCTKCESRAIIRPGENIDTHKEISCPLCEKKRARAIDNISADAMKMIHAAITKVQLSGAAQNLKSNLLNLLSDTPKKEEKKKWF